MCKMLQLAKEIEESYISKYLAMAGIFMGESFHLIQLFRGFFHKSLCS